MTSGDEKPKAFGQAISEAFEPYLSLWVDAQDKYDLPFCLPLELGANF